MVLPNIDQLRRRPVDRAPSRSSGGIFELWKKHSIYRIPAYMKDQNPRAYTPQLVSIGPYHYGASHLAAMEEHKGRSFQQFLDRTNRPFEAYREALRPFTSVLQESYQQLDENWKGDTDKFLRLLVVDGSFLYEFMHGCSNGWDYDPKDPVFSFDALLNICPYIIPDVLMMENQIPLIVIERLIAVQTGRNEQNDEQAHELVYKFMSCTQPFPSIAPGLHVLDVCRKEITKDFHQQTAEEHLPAAVVKSASELSDAGVRFRARRGISFDDGVLSLPLLRFDSGTEPLFLNAIAFEKLHPTAGREVSSYVAFMQGLISCARDVRILTANRLIESSVGSDEAVANLMNKISKDVFFDPHSELCEVRDLLNEYYARNYSKIVLRRLREGWKKEHSIYRIPAYMKDRNPRAYTPQLVSIGPYHYGASNLAATEEHKARSLQHFLDRTNQPLEAYREALRPFTSVLLESYQQLDENWRVDTERFLLLMVVDGSFLYEFLHGCSHYDPNDPVFSFDAVLNCHSIIPDVLMMENQIPLIVIERLIAVQTGRLDEQNDEQAHELVYKFLSCPQPFLSIAPALHVLDISRKVISKDFHQQSAVGRLPAAVVKSASELSDAGVRFLAGRGISFDDGVLSLPLLRFESHTEPLFLNAVAFEKLHLTAVHEVSSYVVFMQGLISCAGDVRILTANGLIESKVGSDEDVANLMNKISKDVFFDPRSELCEVRDLLDKYYAKKMKNMKRQLRWWGRILMRQVSEWWRNLMRILMETYFDNLWTIISVLAATLLLALTFLQTIYTVMGYYKGSPSSS